MIFGGVQHVPAVVVVLDHAQPATQLHLSSHVFLSQGDPCLPFGVDDSDHLAAGERGRGRTFIRWAVSVSSCCVCMIAHSRVAPCPRHWVHHWSPH